MSVLNKILENHFLQKIIFVLLFFSTFVRSHSIKVAGFNFYAYYFFFGLFFLSILKPLCLEFFQKIAIAKNYSLKSVVKKINLLYYFLIFFLAVSLISSSYSIYSGVAGYKYFLYFLWFVFSLVFVFFTVIFFYQRNKEFISKLISIAILLHIVFILYNFVVGNYFQNPDLLIGNFYQNISFWDKNFFFFRVHLFETEPGYLAHYLTLLIACFRLTIVKDKKTIFGIPSFLLYLSALFVLMLPTSRAGGLSITIFFCYEIFVFFTKRDYYNSLLYQVKKKSIFILHYLIFFLLVFFICVRFFYLFDSYYFKGKFNHLYIDNDRTQVKGSSYDGYFAFGDRKSMAKAAIKLWKHNLKNLLIGVGFGLESKSFIKNKMYHSEGQKKRITSEKNLSFDLYTQLLSGSGIFGFVFFLVYFFLLMKRKNKLEYFFLLFLFLGLFLSLSSLPRFSLWFLLAFLVSGSSINLWKKNRQLNY